MSNTTTTQYVYRGLDSKSGEIRLITISAGQGSEPIRCHITHVFLNESPKYEALSYVWGNAAEKVSILLEDCEFFVTSNLGAALRHLRLVSEARTMWIDAVCIDQRNFDERASQVKLMLQIYRDADQVISWLGEDGQDEATEASRLLLSGESHDFSDEFFQQSLLSDDLESRRRYVYLSKMIHIGREYWSRLWIMQEVRVARQGVLQCGQFTMTYDALRRFTKSFNTFMDKSMRRVVEDFDAGTFFLLKQLAFIFQGSEIMGESPIVSKDPLLDLLRKNRHKNATDPRDKVYALLGFSNVDSTIYDGLKIDYNDQCTFRDVYIEAVRATVDATSKLDIICQSVPDHTMMEGASDSDPSAKLPSWVPDWRYTKARPVMRAVHGLVPDRAARDSPASVGISPNGEALSAIGFCVGTVVRCASPLPDCGLVLEGEEQNDQINTVVKEWYQATQIIPGDSTAIKRLFCRTIMAGRDGSNLLWALQLDNDSRGQQRRHDNPQFYRRAREVLLSEIHRNCCGFHFFVSEPIENLRTTGISTSYPLIGLSQPGIVEGDKVCILLGCHYPVLLRHGEEGYKFVSAVFIETLMSGQAIEWLEAGLCDLEAYEIH